MRKVIFVAAALDLLLIGVVGIEVVRATLACIMLVVCAYPAWRYLRLREAALPFMPIICMLWAVYYVTPSITTFPLYAREAFLPNDALDEALALTLLGLVVMITVYYRTAHSFWEGRIPRFPAVSFDEVRARRVGIALGLIGIGTLLVTTSVRFPTSIQQLTDLMGQLSVLAMAMLFYLQLSSSLPRTHTMFLWLFLVPVQALFDLSGGLLSPVIRDSLALLMIYFIVRWRIPWTAVAIALVVGSMLVIAKPDFRKTTSGQSQQGIAVSRAFNYGPLMAHSLTVITDRNLLANSLTYDVNRLDDRAVFARVIYFTPNQVPYWGGQTYLNLLWRLVPRFVWSDKPSEALGQDFGHRYGLLDNTDTTTSVNLPINIEFYANFGILGVLIGMALVGLIYSALRYVLENPLAGEWSMFCAVIIYAELFNFESNFSLVFGNVIWFMLVLSVIGRVVFPKSVAGIRPPAGIGSSPGQLPRRHDARSKSVPSQRALR